MAYGALDGPSQAPAGDLVGAAVADAALLLETVDLGVGFHELDVSAVGQELGGAGVHLGSVAGEIGSDPIAVHHLEGSVGGDIGLGQMGSADQGKFGGWEEGEWGGSCQRWWWPCIGYLLTQITD